jgi:guanylate kinase
VIFEFFKDPEFFRTQPVIKGAKEFVRKLSQMTEVFVSTSVYPQFMSIRAQRIMEEFPEIPADHIYMGSRKDKIDVDILFDDGAHNIFNSNAAYPILMRRPWNREATGVLAVNTYDEFLKLVEVIADSYRVRSTPTLTEEPAVVVLVGPSGSGKNEVARGLEQQCPKMERLVSYTTAEGLDPVSRERYRQVSEQDFLTMYQNGELFESTNYANHYYGSRKADVESILRSGHHALTVMDICGAMSLKTHFPRVVTIYVKRNRRDLLSSILEKDIPNREKVNRLLALESERANAEVCDYVVEFTDCHQAVREILSRLNIR